MNSHNIVLLHEPDNIKRLPKDIAWTIEDLDNRTMSLGTAISVIKESIKENGKFRRFEVDFSPEKCFIKVKLWFSNDKYYCYKAIRFTPI